MTHVAELVTLLPILRTKDGSEPQVGCFKDYLSDIRESKLLILGRKRRELEGSVKINLHRKSWNDL